MVTEKAFDVQYIFAGSSSAWDMETINAAIFTYFEGGFTYTEILEFLRVRHGYVMSLSTLKRWLRKKGMRKRPLEAIRNDASDIFEAVRDELSGSGADIGYRRIHKALKSKGYICRRDDMRQIVKQEDMKQMVLTLYGT